MQWIEVSIETKHEQIENLCENLAALGVEGMSIEDENDFKDFLENNQQYWDYVDSELEARFTGVSKIKLYISNDGEGQKILNKIKSELKIEPKTTIVDDADWENNWKQYYKPLEIGEKLLVIPEWEEIETHGRVALKLDPGLIFGTGSHATTRMCLCALENLAERSPRTLDLGCGSGILGIGALLLGSGEVCGCDIDPKAPDVALENARLNGITTENFKIYAGDVLSDKNLRKTLGSGYNLVLANIVADVIIPLCAIARGFMAPGASFVCSGIIEGRQDEVKAALLQNGFEITAHRCEEEWHCFTAK